MPLSVPASLNVTPPIVAAGWFQNAYVYWGLLIVAIVGLIAAGVFVALKRRELVLGLIRHPFAKYVMISVVAHLILAGWLISSHLFDVEKLAGPAVVTVDLGTDSSMAFQPSDKPWDNPTTEISEGTIPKLPEQSTELPDIERPPVEPRKVAEPTSTELPLPDLPVDASALPEMPESDSAWPPAESSSFTSTSEASSFGQLDDAPRSPDTTAFTSSTPASNQNQATLQEPVFANPSQQDFATASELPELNNTEATKFAQQPENRYEPQFPEPTHTPTNDTGGNVIDAAARFTQADTTGDFSPDPPTEVVKAEPQESERFATKQATQPQAKLSSKIHAVSSNQDLASKAVQSSRHQNISSVPPIYRDRWAENRLAVARSRGGSQETEAAVLSALKWLANNQAMDGRWDASRHGSGQPLRVDGHNRGQAGLNADTATTGLAMLAFLGAGQTHQEGEHQELIRRSINFLLSEQRSDGNLSGQAGGYAAMYCHGIATLALSEAHSLTGDPALLQPVRRALEYTISSQHPAGGWRYHPLQPGDTSQLGWQLMALTSAYYGGHRIPRTAWTRAGTFLQKVAWGAQGGRASYTPNSRPTRTMTAEATLCRLFLNTAPDHPKIQEGARYLLEELPGRGRLNYYYWYYGTLSLYHLQDEKWEIWNRAVTQELLGRQSRDGSWPVANSVWGQAGGKVYTTALAAMTLEVYYRYRPLTEKRGVEHTAQRTGQR